MVPSKVKSRLVGAILIAWGVGLCVFAWGQIHSDSRFVTPGAAALGPFLIASGLWVVIEAPPIPVREYTTLGRILTAIGAVSGLLFGFYARGWFRSF